MFVTSRKLALIVDKCENCWRKLNIHVSKWFKNPSRNLFIPPQRAKSFKSHERSIFFHCISSRKHLMLWSYCKMKTPRMKSESFDVIATYLECVILCRKKDEKSLIDNSKTSRIIVITICNIDLFRVRLRISIWFFLTLKRFTFPRQYPVIGWRFLNDTRRWNQKSGNVARNGDRKRRDIDALSLERGGSFWEKKDGNIIIKVTKKFISSKRVIKWTKTKKFVEERDMWRYQISS